VASRAIVRSAGRRADGSERPELAERRRSGFGPDNEVSSQRGCAYEDLSINAIGMTPQSFLLCASMMLGFAPVVICQRLDDMTIADAAATACIHHPLQLGAKGRQLSDTAIYFAHVTTRDAVGLYA
jgi:hypothetical protein